MAIYQRDRDFRNLFSDISVNVIPIRFVYDVTFYLADGSKVTYDDTHFKSDDLNLNDLESIVRNLDFYEDLTDLAIRINYDLVEQVVSRDVAKMLSNLKK
jgi:hypothetical protein